MNTFCEHHKNSIKFGYLLYNEHVRQRVRTTKAEVELAERIWRRTRAIRNRSSAITFRPDVDAAGLWPVPEAVGVRSARRARQTAQSQTEPVNTVSPRGAYLKFFRINRISGRPSLLDKDLPPRR